MRVEYVFNHSPALQLQYKTRGKQLNDRPLFPVMPNRPLTHSPSSFPCFHRLPLHLSPDHRQA